MKQLKLNGPYIKWEHVAEMGTGISGVIPQRFPTAALNNFGDMARIARMTAGIEMQIKGRLSKLDIDIRLLDSDMYGVVAELFSGPHKMLPTWNINPHSADVQTISFDIENNYCSQYPVRLLFPTHCALEIISVAVNDDAELIADFKPYDYSDVTGQPGRKWLIHGDSITQGSNVSTPSCTWVDITARMLNIVPTNLGIGSYGKAEIVMAEYIASRNDYDLLSLYIGVNCLEAEEFNGFENRFNKYIKIIRNTHPVTPIVVCTPIFCMFDTGKKAKNIQEIRTLITQQCQSMKSAGDNQLFLINGLDIIDDPYYLRADLLHLSDFGAMKYAMGMVPYLQMFLAESDKNNTFA